MTVLAPVGRRRVIDDDDLGEVRADSREVLYKVSLLLDARTPEEAPANQASGVQQVNHRVRVVLQGRGEDYHFVPPRHGSQKAVNVRPLGDKKRAPRGVVCRRYVHFPVVPL